MLLAFHLRQDQTLNVGNTIPFPRILPFTKQMRYDKIAEDNLHLSVHLMSMDTGLRCEGVFHYHRPGCGKQRRKRSSAELWFCLKSLRWAPALSSYITKWWHNIYEGSGAGVERTCICSHNESLEVTRGVIWIIINNPSSRATRAACKFDGPAVAPLEEEGALLPLSGVLSCDPSRPRWLAYCS